LLASAVTAAQPITNKQKRIKKPPKFDLVSMVTEFRKQLLSAMLENLTLLFLIKAR
jgi:hypothetical protein